MLASGRKLDGEEEGGEEEGGEVRMGRGDNKVQLQH